METSATVKHTREDGIKFLNSLDLEYPPVNMLVLTNSGIVEPMPTTQDDWDEFKLNVEKRKDNNE